MAYSLSVRSKKNLIRVHPDLVSIVYEVLKIIDISVISGLRTLGEQAELLREGKSKTINSKHLIQGDGYSHAVDIAPYPIDWDNIERFEVMCNIVQYVADLKGIDVRLGRDFVTWKDYPHIELRRR